jgi:hypothetical protein
MRKLAANKIAALTKESRLATTTNTLDDVIVPSIAGRTDVEGFGAPDGIALRWTYAELLMYMLCSFHRG